ncbi:hypothetical protein EDB83DRAFT_2528792 [Lactarius deliciosus]|nr:hypothetical protein EDB83DRAFT_2528792 [Lactarius deliciosus]
MALIRRIIAVFMKINLPFEILTAIFEEVDDVRDIWHIRAASRTFCAAATPFAFRILSVITTTGSTQNLGQLFDAPDIVAHVRQVAYLDTGADRIGSTLMYVDELASLFSRVHQLPLLETINLTFYPGYGAQFGSDSGTLALQSLALQACILGALAASFGIRVPPKLTSLSLHNLRIWELSPLESPSFQTALTTLRCFQLSLLLDDPPGSEIYDPWCNLWGTLCSCMVLTPMQHSLTELTLHSNAHVNASSGLSFAALHFPRLCTLSLKRLVFEPSFPIDTSIYFTPSPSSSAALAGDEESGSGPDNWARVWDCFAAKLTALVSPRVDEDSDACGSDFRYEFHDPRSAAYWFTDLFTARDAADAAGLQRFHETVATQSEEVRRAEGSV